MKHIVPINIKAHRLQALAGEAKNNVRALQDDVPFGCTTVFSPGWEVDSGGGTHGLCQPIERDLYDCYHSCYWPAQVPDGLTNWPAWAESCGGPQSDWKNIDLVFP